MEAQGVLVRALLAAGDAARALSLAEPAVAASASLDAELQSGARFHLALALTAARKDHARACALAAEARGLSARDVAYVAEIAGWAKKADARRVGEAPIIARRGPREPDTVGGWSVDVGLLARVPERA
jgi:hypothetical protein